VDEWYQRLDTLVGEVESASRIRGLPEANIYIVSDHGFTSFEYKVHLNRWFLEKGYLKVKKGHQADDLSSVDWSSSQCFAVGLNSVYLNRAGREVSGQVSHAQAGTLVAKLTAELSSLTGPNGNNSISRVWQSQEAFTGAFQEQAPDLVIGYSPGYRASSETGLGCFGGEQAITPNRDHWNADHCIDFTAVPGVLFANRSIRNWPTPSYGDFPSMVIGRNPKQSGGPPTPPPSSTDHEEEKALQERLKSLGYL
jgi:predicted AlkP superfamily phosphohydrolase/phosphomutase